MIPIFHLTLLDEFIEMAKEAALPRDKEQFKATQRKEVDLWHHWNNNGRKPEHLKPLYESFKPLLHKESNKYRGVEIPKSAINAEMRKQFVTAMTTFNPTKAALNTWVQQNLKKSSRFIKTYQNLGKIPEGQIAKIREFKQAKEHLSNTLGFEPDTKAIADHLKWSPKQVAQLTKELSRKDMIASQFAEDQDPAELLNSKELEAIHILQYDSRLTPEERTVYEYTWGLNGKPRLQPGQISKQTGIHPSKVSRIRGKITTYVQDAAKFL